MPMKARKTACRKMKRDQDLSLVWETQCQASTQPPKFKGQRSHGTACQDGLGQERQHEAREVQ